MSNWYEEAACRGMAGEIFFGPQQRESGQARRIRETLAKSICQRCASREPCLARAMETQTEYGIWGGMTPKERLYKERRQVAEVSRPRRAPISPTSVADGRVVEVRMSVSDVKIELIQTDTAETWHGCHWSVLQDGKAIYFAEDEADAWLFFHTLCLS